MMMLLVLLFDLKLSEAIKMLLLLFDLNHFEAMKNVVVVGFLLFFG